MLPGFLFGTSVRRAWADLWVLGILSVCSVAQSAAASDLEACAAKPNADCLIETVLATTSPVGIYDDPEGLVLATLARQFLREGRKDYAFALAARSSSADSYTSLAKAAIDTGEPALALMAIDLGEARTRPKDELDRSWMNLRADAGDLPGAVNRGRAHIEQNWNRQYLTELAKLETRMGEHTAALRRAATLEAPKEQYLIELAVLKELALLGDVEQAHDLIDHIRERELSPEPSVEAAFAVSLHIGLNLQRLGKPDEAKEAFLRAEAMLAGFEAGPHRVHAIDLLSKAFEEAGFEALAQRYQNLAIADLLAEDLNLDRFSQSDDLSVFNTLRPRQLKRRESSWFLEKLEGMLRKQYIAGDDPRALTILRIVRDWADGAQNSEIRVEALAHLVSLQHQFRGTDQVEETLAEIEDMAKDPSNQAHRLQFEDRLFRAHLDLGNLDEAYAVYRESFNQDKYTNIGFSLGSLAARYIDQKKSAKAAEVIRNIKSPNIRFIALCALRENAAKDSEIPEIDRQMDDTVQELLADATSTDLESGLRVHHLMDIAKVMKEEGCEIGSEKDSTQTQ